MTTAADQKRSVEVPAGDNPSGANVLRIGTFNAEAYWQTAGKASFPSIPDPAASDLVATLGELMIPWRSSSGTLVTMLPIESAQLSYMRSLGLNFQQRGLFTSIQEWQEVGKPACSYKVAAAQAKTCPIEWLDFRISPYAVTENFSNFAAICGQPDLWPKSDNVAIVNSKIFSTQLNQRFMPKPRIAIIRSIADLGSFAADLAGSPFLLKEPFGVSGKGHFAVKNQAGLDRLKKLLMRQSEKGLELEFVAEALLDKAEDFSCFCEIDVHGNVNIRGVQSMHNRGFAYLGSSPANSALLKHLEQQSYFETLTAYLKAIHAQGYWGPVCIDSMMLSDRTLWPVVEINARESMGIIANSICGFLAGHGVKGVLTFMIFSAKSVQPYEELLEALSKTGLLWLPGKTKGILPLSSTSLYITRSSSEESLTKGRWYAMLLGATAQEQAAVRDQWTLLCAEQFSWQVLEPPCIQEAAA